MQTHESAKKLSRLEGSSINDQSGFKSMKLQPVKRIQNRNNQNRIETIDEKEEQENRDSVQKNDYD